MPLLQESTPKRDILTKVDSETQSPYSDMLASAQLIVASQLMASRMGLPTTPAFFHPSFLPLPWSAGSPPSPPSGDQIKTLKNNNNNVVSSSSAEPVRKRKPWKSEDEISTPTSSVSPPGGASVPKEAARDRPFTCQICNRSFNYKHVLQNHERTHTGEKPFECQQCHKKFTRDHHLKTHMRLHTGERPYSCNYCDKKFVQVANLRRHLRVHTGERPYACDYCSAKFSDSNQLKAHVDIHTNEKRFECERCHCRFRRRHHLVHHKCGASEEDSILESEPEDDLRKPRVLHPTTHPIVTLPLCVALPEQTEPEDLSMGRHSHSHSSGDSPMSRSPSSREDAEEEDFDPRDSAELLLKGLHS